MRALFQYKPFSEMSMQDMSYMIDINLLMYIAKLFLPLMNTVVKCFL